MTRLREALAAATGTLARALTGDRGVAGPESRLEAQVLLAHALGRGRAYLYAHPEEELSAVEAATFADLIARRAAGVPVAHLTGRREFWGLALEVGAEALIPRPDTETLVEAALERLPAHQEMTVLDLGTGTGAVALALARERPRARVWAVERSPAALALARRNRDRLGLQRVELVAGDWFAPFPGRRFDLVVGNPPYVAAGDPHLARGDLRHEPREALVAGGDGLAAIRAIVAAAPEHLDGGWLLLEHGWDQGGAVRGILAAAGLAEVFTRRDLGGRERVSGGRGRV